MNVLISKHAQEALEQRFNDEEGRLKFIEAANMLQASPESGKLIDDGSTTRELAIGDLRIVYERVGDQKAEDGTLLILTVFRAGTGLPPPPQATVAALDRWVHDCEGRWAMLIRGLPEDDAARCPHGHYTFAYAVLDAIPEQGLGELMTRLTESVVHHTGWPPWWVPTREEIAPQPVDGLIECWLGKGGTLRDAAHSDFWRASRDARLFLLRGYQEDGTEIPHVQPGSVLDVTLPIWRAGEALLHAAKFSSMLGLQNATILFRASYAGLKSRKLAHIANQRYIMSGTYVSHDDLVVSKVTTTARQIEETLQSVVYSLLAKLYETFDFYELPSKMVGDELSLMRQNKF